MARERISKRNLEHALAWTPFYESTTRDSPLPGFKHAVTKVESSFDNDAVHSAFQLIVSEASGWYQDTMDGTSEATSWNDPQGANPKEYLRLRVRALQPTTERASTGSMLYAIIELQPLPKLRMSSLPVPTKHLIRAPSKEIDWGARYVHVRVRQSWIPLARLMKMMRIKARDNLIQEAENFTGRRPSTAEAAEHSIDIEIERRINEMRLAAISPMPLFFQKLPPELRMQVWSHVMNLQPCVRPGSYLEQPEWPFYQSFDFAPQNVRDLVCTGGLVTREAIDVLYMSPCFSFGLPRKLHRWLNGLTRANRAKIRHLELAFDGDTFLKYLSPFLGFDFVRNTRHLRRMLRGYSIVHLLDRLGTQKMHLTIRLPFLWRMKEYGFEGRCYMTMCKWIIKGIMCAVHERSETIVEFKGQVGHDGAEEISKKQMEELLQVQQKHLEIAWEDLRIDEDEDEEGIDRPPRLLVLDTDESQGEETEPTTPGTPTTQNEAAEGA